MKWTSEGHSECWAYVNIPFIIWKPASYTGCGEDAITICHRWISSLVNLYLNIWKLTWGVIHVLYTIKLIGSTVSVSWEVILRNSIWNISWLLIMTIYDNLYNFLTFETLFKIPSIENLNFWQLIVTLDRICNSCDVFFILWMCLLLFIEINK